MFLLKNRQKYDSGALKVTVVPGGGIPSTYYKFNGIACKSNGHIYIDTSDSVGSDAIKTEGYALTPAGALYVTEDTNQTFVNRYCHRTTLDGRLLVTFAFPGAGRKANGNVFDSNGAVHVDIDSIFTEAYEEVLTELNEPILIE